MQDCQFVPYNLGSQELRTPCPYELFLVLPVFAYLAIHALKSISFYEPTFIISNNEELEPKDLLTIYARRWHIENKLAEMVDFLVSMPFRLRSWPASCLTCSGYDGSGKAKSRHPSPLVRQPTRPDHLDGLIMTLRDAVKIGVEMKKFIASVSLAVLIYFSFVGFWEAESTPPAEETANATAPAAEEAAPATEEGAYAH